jgi:hypothetical protein
MRTTALSMAFALGFALSANAQSLGLDEFKPSADAYEGCFDLTISIDEASRERLISMRASCMQAKEALPEDSTNLNLRIKEIDNAIDGKKKRK